MGFVTDLLGDLTGANDAADAAGRASDLQYQATREGVAENSRQFDKFVQLISPFVNMGTKSLTGQGDLLGLNGDSARAAAIGAIEDGAEFGALSRQGENAILQNASATGGLRGGNVQGALAQFRPQLLNQLIGQQFDRLGGITTLGANAAAGQGSAGMATGRANSDLIQQGGAAQAGGILAQGNARRGAFGDALKIGGVIGGFF